MSTSSPLPTGAAENSAAPVASVGTSAAPHAELLAVRDLQKSFTGPDGVTTPIIDIPTFAMDAGRQVALQGGSGTGKTTLLHLIAGILQPDSGSIRLDGQEVGRLPESQRDSLRARKIGYVFQTFNLLQGLTALENVSLAMTFGGQRANSGWARELLMRVGLGERLSYLPRQLSVGQQQRVAVARALANRPRLVLADEPTGNLDRRHANEAMTLIRSICAEAGAALLLVSHDPDMLALFEQREDLAELNRASAAHLDSTAAPLSTGAHS